ncbi:MAG: helix-turn-helix domain-containing protein [Anaerolineaceae bacterium]|nr:helix-turn-helix domain-containing protein [Anaerolineaceae bacterium]
MSHNDKDTSDPQTWFTVTEAASYIRVTRQTIYRYMDDGALKYYVLKSGGGRRLKKADLDALLEPPSETSGESSN